MSICFSVILKITDGLLRVGMHIKAPDSIQKIAFELISTHATSPAPDKNKPSPNSHLESWNSKIHACIDLPKSVIKVAGQRMNQLHNLSRLV